MFNKEAYERIAKEVSPNVKILAATKTKPTKDIQEAIKSGIKIIGENYVQEAEEKYKELKEFFKENNVSFHLIGHLQSNKAKIAAAIFDCVQTIDSLKLAKKLDSACKELDKTIDVFIEINFEEQKSGIKIGNLDELISQLKNLQNLNLLGFMVIPPLGKEKECFSKLKELKEKYNLEELSIGMSSDYLSAIESGSTLIRLGTALFGERA
jgi:pyridoxal phosphate enzyme (YggS family)